MSCSQFKKWLTYKDLVPHQDNEQARDHASQCLSCARLLKLDDATENAIKASLLRVEAPAGLRASVALIATETNAGKTRPSWPKLAMSGSAMAGVLLLLFVYQPFTSSLTSMDQIARLADKNHHAGLSMQFDTRGSIDISNWFRDRLDFDVVLPSLEGRGLTLLGGRKCSLNNEDVACLFYAQGGKPCSLFVLAAKSVKLVMEEGQNYRYPVGNCVVEAWKEGDKVFVLVV